MVRLVDGPVDWDVKQLVTHKSQQKKKDSDFKTSYFHLCQVRRLTKHYIFFGILTLNV